MLSFIGMGLYGYDMSIEALKEAKSCDKLYAEFYTSRLGISIEEMEKIIGKKIKILTREEVEDGKALINEAKSSKIGFLVAGDPMAATTHISLRLQAMKEGVETKIFHGISIACAAASMLGLQIYKFGRIVSLPKPSENYFPLSPYDAIKDNLAMGLHTLVLLDTGEKPMTANEGLELLLEMEKRKKGGIIKLDSIMAVISISYEKKVARAGYLENLLEEDFGEHIHSIVIPGKLHPVEAEALIKIANAPEEILK